MPPVKYHLGQFPPREMNWQKLNLLIGAANAGLGRYDGLLSAIPNTHILLSPLITQEAVLSSKIEGTLVTMGEVLEIEASGGSSNIAQPKRDDAEEVLNYRRALQVCAAEMENRPLSQRLLSAIHKLLMEGVRGRDKDPGIYRKEQNWIGPRGCTIENASFIPIAPEHLQQAMDDWERYLNITAELDALVQLAVLHVEFEAIHPFKDGNGRLGRMLIPLFLYQHKLLGSPNFYMSAYLEANREEYQEKLRAVSRDGNWTEWCEFFLRGIQQQAAENERKARAILALYDRVKKQVSDWTHSQYSIKAVDFIFKSTIFSAPQFTGYSSIPRPTAARILSILKDRGLLVPLRQGKGGRAGIFVFRDLFNIAEGKDVF